MDNDIDDSPLKPVASGSAQTTPSTTKGKGKRKGNYYEAKAPTSTPSKKVKTENVSGLVIFLFSISISSLKPALSNDGIHFHCN